MAARRCAASFGRSTSQSGNGGAHQRVIKRHVQVPSGAVGSTCRTPDQFFVNPLGGARTVPTGRGKTGSSTESAATAALNDAATHIAVRELPFEQRLALRVQREVEWRDSKRLERVLKTARSKVSSACLEDIDWRGSRGLSREVISSLAGRDWLRHGHNVLLTGATGCGKTWLAYALGQQAARLGFSVLFIRAPRLV